MLDELELREPRDHFAHRRGTHPKLARESLRALLADERVPAAVRESLAEDYAQVQAMLDKLEHGHIHIAVFGRVSVGKSALVNALLGEERFSISPLHGETRKEDRHPWQSLREGRVVLIDTPGINEIGGETRESMARDVAARADVAPPNLGGCQDKKAGDACKTDDGKDGYCKTSTCSRNDYSQGTPPRSVDYECLLCTEGAPPTQP